MPVHLCLTLMRLCLIIRIRIRKSSLSSPLLSSAPKKKREFPYAQVLQVIQ
jgi:hypothetical protein